MKKKSVERKLKRHFQDQTEYLPTLAVEGVTNHRRVYSARRLQKPLLIALTAYLAISIAVVAWVAVRYMDEVEPAATTTQTSDETESEEYAPDPKQYYDENGVYVCENVPISWNMEQTFVDISDIKPIFSFEPAPENSGINISGVIRGEYPGTVAIIEKISSVSYYKSYEDGRAPLAYTLSTLKILDLPDENTDGLVIGDEVTVLESYAFSPEDPDRIYHSHFRVDFGYKLIPVVFGIIATDSPYLVVLMDGEPFEKQFNCYETGKELSESIALTEPVYFCYSDIYPLSGDVYWSLFESYFIEYHVSICNDKSSWYWGYNQALNEYYWNEENDIE
ncbi:MAG: hypothetical protein IJX47_06675 [Clostridia bacterium]|nr:hypothetical protein [Clostridia bacterium]